MSIPPEVERIFLDELAKRGIEAKRSEDGLGYTLQMDDSSVNVSLENVARDYERDGDRGRIERFVETVVAGVSLPKWEEAIHRIRWSPEPADIERGDTLCQEVSDQVVLVLVYVSEDETQIVWLTPSLVEDWQRDEDDLWSAAAHNMNAILEQTEVQFEELDDHKLGMVTTNYEAFKAALMFAPNLKESVEFVLGWPLYAVAPCRDFLYLLHQDDRDLLPRLGQVVVREYQQSSYPVSTEVFEISDEGVGTYAEFQSAPAIELDEDGMQTIDLAGLFSMRLPGEWVEDDPEDDEDEELGVVFYDPDADTGTFRIYLQQYQSPEPMTNERVREILNNTDEPTKSEISDLEGESYLITYTHEAEEDDELVTILFWQVAHVAPPDSLYIALCSFTYESREADSDEVKRHREMLDREIRACYFAETDG